ncbi:hypothetical protein BDR04DRAFT_890080 [Suillus decipiens]|nr:hypothetical protein BDR04DRAFT_890080 [Suillus decipiens]
MRYAVHHKPAISDVSPVPAPITTTIDPPQPVSPGFLRKLLSSRTDRVRPIRTSEPLDVCVFLLVLFTINSTVSLQFLAPASLSRPYANPHENVSGDCCHHIFDWPF